MEINDSNFSEVMAQGKPVVLDFWATWCGPCQRLAPIISELAEQYHDRVIIGKVDIEDETEELTAWFGVRTIPTLVFIKNSEVVDRMVGAAQKSVIEEKIKALL